MAGRDELDWLFGGDTGLSSECIWRAMVGQPEPADWLRSGAYPHDPSDFGRCLRLFERFPHWRARLPEMAAHGPVWAGLVEAWPKIEHEYREAVAANAKESRECYRLIREVINNATAVAS